MVIFALAFVVVIMMLGLLFDSARGIVLRRQLQDASDAAALAAANVVLAQSPQGCSATKGPPPGSPQAAVVTAAKNSVAANVPGYNLNNVVVTCLNGWDNYAVQVNLTGTSGTFFGSIFGLGSLTANTQSVAVNGQTSAGVFSVVLLDPSNLSWSGTTNGCPSFAINGGITATFDSSIYVDSSCVASNGGAFASKGGSAALSFAGNAVMRLVGEYKPQSLTVTPAPLEHQNPRPDPLAGLAVPPVSSIKQQSASKLVINGNAAGQCTSNGLVYGTNGCILQPGVYVGGIQLKSSAVIYMKPGIYVFQDGGLSLGAQSKLFTIAANATGATEATWASTDCPDGSCGVLMYKTTVSSTDQITVTAGATFMARAFNPDVDTTVLTGPGTYDKESYRNLLIWQDGSPAPSGPPNPAYSQPSIQLQGGGNAVLQGTIYAPSALVTLGGTPGGSGGTLDLTLQFIVWDLNLSGNANFHFVYSENAFARPIDYGLIQ